MQLTTTSTTTPWCSPTCCAGDCQGQQESESNAFERFSVRLLLVSVGVILVAGAFVVALVIKLPPIGWIGFAIVAATRCGASMSDALGAFAAARFLLATPSDSETYWLERSLLEKPRRLTPFRSSTSSSRRPAPRGTAPLARAGSVPV
jgi:hypothetical protein